jgi:hypothetical protein
MFKDLTKEVPPIMHVLNIHENLLEALLEMGNYAGNHQSRLLLRTKIIKDDVYSDDL